MNNEFKRLVHKHPNDTHIGKQLTWFFFNFFNVDIRLLHPHIVSYRI